MKKGLPLLLFLCVFFQLNAQSQTSTVTGTVLDENTKEAIELASIRIMNAKDSAYVSGTVTNENGKFTIGLKTGNYIAQISFLGYKNKFVNINARGNVALGEIMLSDDGVLLGEAEIVAIAPEIVVKGDTVEYNADSYKVQESAVLEDLIKKIPGAEIDSDGKIKVNGKDISKILVDGKEFFSDDPKTASQNLPAKMVEKLQVLDKKSDMAQLTGFDDGNEETVINLVVKPDMKQGLYGNALAGYGNKDRYEGNGFVNYAKNDTRLSVLGNINNTNNVNSNTRGSGRGVTATKEGGLNFATDFSPTLKWDGDVYYSYTDNDVSSRQNTTYTKVNKLENSTSIQNNKNDVFNMRQRLEWAPDSMTQIIFRPNIRYTRNNSMSIAESFLDDKDDPTANWQTNKNNNSNSKNFNLSGELLVNRKLGNNGRSITMQLSGGFSDGDGDGRTYSVTDHIDPSKTDEVRDQIYNQDDKGNNFRVRLSYLEPIGRNNFLELAYQISKRYSETDKKTYDYNNVTHDYTDIASDYTRLTKNDFLNQNVSLSFQARRQKYNYTIGLGLEPSSSKTRITDPVEEKNLPRKNYLNLAPRLEFNYIWDRRHNLRMRYFSWTNQPTTMQLFDGVISQDGMNKTVGNPNLKPSFQNNFYLRYQRSMPETASSVSAFARFSHTSNDIITISTWDASNGRTSTYENISGNMNGNFRLMYNRPLRNRKFSFNTSTYGSYRRDNTLIGQNQSAVQEKNTANVFNIGEDLRLKFNSDMFQFDLGGRISYETASNSLSKTADRDIYNYGGFGSFTWYLPLSFTLESDMNYSSNSGYGSGYEQNEWLWNASISKQFLKSKNATLRFKIYDILQERSSISRNTKAEYYTDTFNNSISSYFMVNLIIRFQSFKGGAKRADMDDSGGGRERRGPGPGGSRGGYGGGPVRF